MAIALALLLFIAVALYDRRHHHMLRLCFRGHGYYSTQRCTRCEKERDVRRGTSTQRGYDAPYRQRRRAAIDAEPWCHTEPACPYSDSGTSDNPLTADHVLPISQGGKYGPLTVLCKRCNSAKRDRYRAVRSAHRPTRF